MTDDEAAEWADAVGQIHTESGGVLNVIVLRPYDMPPLLAAALLGSAEAVWLLNVVELNMKEIARAPRRKPKLCACCPRCIRKRDRFALAIAVPSRDRPRRALAMAICEKCDDGGDLQGKAAEALRRIWPEARTVTLTDHAGGHA